MKKRTMILLFGVIILIIATFCVIFLQPNGIIGGLFSNSKDTFGATVSYRDDACKIPIGTSISYMLSHEKIDTYKIKTDATGMLPMAYDATIEEGNAIIRIKDEDNILKEYNVKVKDKFTMQLEPNHNYSIEICIKNGKGTINLMWMEMV